VIQNNSPSSAAFYFLAFGWRDYPNAPLYVHCYVRICDYYEEDCAIVSIIKFCAERGYKLIALSRFFCQRISIVFGTSSLAESFVTFLLLTIRNLETGN